METVSCTWKQFEKGALLLAEQIKQKDWDTTFIFGIPRGGLVLAVRLSHLLDIPLLIKDPLSNEAIGNVLIVDDISDSGKTLLPYKEKKYRIVTLYCKKGSVTAPDLWIYQKKEKWILFPWEKN